MAETFNGHPVIVATLSIGTFIGSFRYAFGEVGAVEAATVSPRVWYSLAVETDYGAQPGTRLREKLEICTPWGWVPLTAGNIDDERYEAELYPKRGGVVYLDLRELLHA